MGAGWLFGQTPFVRDNFSLITLGIVFVSVLPVLIEIARAVLRATALSQGLLQDR
jgi:membrane-associated protein